MYVSRGKAADMLGVSKRTIITLQEQGHLTGYRLPGGEWRISRQSIAALIKAGTPRNQWDDDEAACN